MFPISTGTNFVGLILDSQQEQHKGPGEAVKQRLEERTLKERWTSSWNRGLLNGVSGSDALLNLAVCF